MRGGGKNVETPNVSGQFAEKDGDAAERKGHTDGDEDGEGWEPREVFGRGVGEGFLQVTKVQTT